MSFQIICSGFDYKICDVLFMKCDSLILTGSCCKYTLDMWWWMINDDDGSASSS